jgi:hypothetical protein
MKTQILMLLAATVVLSACGGGGSATPTAQVGVATPAVAAPAAALGDTTPNVTVSIPTYAVGRDSRQVFELLNAIRVQIGLGPQSQDAKLDVAAKGHADWMALNKAVAHEQITGSAGFTGVSPLDRVASAGYVYEPVKPQRVREVVVDTIYGQTVLDSISVLLNAPYHALEMISSHRDSGIGIGEYSYVTNNLVNGISGTTTITQNFIAIEYSTKILEYRQLTGTDTITILPCNGMIGVAHTLRGETPNPVPGRNLATSPLGTSVAVRVREGQVLTLSSATMTKISDGSTVPMRAPVTQRNDPNFIYLDASSGFISAEVPMLPLTQYRTVVNGTNDGRAFTKTCDFTTGA